MYMHVYVCMYVCMCVYVCMYVCTCMCMYVCMCVYVCVYVCTCMCMYVCMCVCTYVHACVGILWVLTGENGEEEEIVREGDEPVVAEVGKHTVRTPLSLSILLLPVLRK